MITYEEARALREALSALSELAEQLQIPPEDFIGNVTEEKLRTGELIGKN